MEHKNTENSVYCVEYGNGNVACPVLQVGSDNMLMPTLTYKVASRRAIALIVIFILLILAGGSALAWYFLEYRVWVLEVQVEQQYIGQISILNRNFSTALSSHTSRAFREEARSVEAMLEKLVKSSNVLRYFKSATVFGFSEGSVVAHFWLILSLPESHVGKVTMQIVNESLLGILQSFRETGDKDTVHSEGYLLHLSSFSLSETQPKVIDFLQASFDCYRYQSVTDSIPVVLKGPNTQRSSCLWHLKAPEGSQLELRVEWLLPECRDRLAIYDSITPADSSLITSLYGCSRHEQVVQVLSSADWMTVVWKQGQYNYKDPFSLSAQAWPKKNCSYDINLERMEGVQGNLRTPFYPSYYPPNTNCTWQFTIPSSNYGLTLEFEGYELSRASYNHNCTQGQWLIQNRSEPVPISGVIGHQGRKHPGRSANPSQGTHTLIHSRNHTLRTIFQRCQSTYHACLWTGEETEYPEETPEARGEHANSTHTRQRRESNPQPWRCEANVLTTKPPCPLLAFNYMETNNI